MTVLQTLNILEQFDLRALEHNSPEFVHLVVEAMKLAFVDEDAFNTGKSYAKIPLDRLLSKAYGKQQAARIDLGRPQFYEPSKRPAATNPAFQHTTNHAVVDRDHNVVVITQTLMLPAGVVVPETGVIFNNGMSYFSADAQDINYIEAGQRPRFVMSPTIVTNHGQPYFALGSAGGWTIPQTIVQVAVRALDYRMDAHEAVKAPRFVLQYLGNSIPYFPGTDLRLEKGFSDQTRSGLTAKGHRLLDQEGWLGMLNGIMIYPRTGALSAGADARREGHAALDGQRYQALPAVVRRRGLDHESALAEAAQDAAEIAVIEAEFRGDFGRGRLVPASEFVEHARFGERVGGLQEAVLEHADPPRVEAVEVADCTDAPLEIDRGCRCHGEPRGYNVT